MKLNQEHLEETRIPEEDSARITAVSRVGIEGYLKIALADLEEDYDEGQRIEAIAYILMPREYPLKTENKDFHEEVELIKENYQHPEKLIQYVRKAQTYQSDDSQLAAEIRSIQQSVLMQELKKLDSNHPLLNSLKLSGNQTTNDLKASIKESPLLNYSTLATHFETVSTTLPSDDILKREHGFLPKVEEYMPIIWLQYPMGSSRMLYTFLKMTAIFKQFDLPSYKILDREFNEIDGIRGKFDNIFIYLTPDLSLEQVKRLMSVLGKPKTRSEEVFLYNIEFDFERNRYRETGGYRQSISAALSKVDDLKIHSLELSYPYLFAMNTLLRHDQTKWTDSDVRLAVDLVETFDRKELDIHREDARGRLRLPSSELELCIAKYYDNMNRLKEAHNYYLKAFLRLNYVFAREPKTANTLSALIRCLDSLIVVELRSGNSATSINDHIRSLNGFIDELKQIKPLAILTISKRDEIPILVETEEKSKEILKVVKPLGRFQKSAFFTQQIDKSCHFDLGAFLKLTRFPNSKIIHVKKGLVHGIEFYTRTLEDARVLYRTLLKILADSDEKKYGGKIQLDEFECEIDISFNAFDDLLRCMNLARDVPAPTPTKSLSPNDLYAAENLLSSIVGTLTKSKSEVTEPSLSTPLCGESEGSETSSDESSLGCN